MRRGRRAIIALVAVGALLLGGVAYAWEQWLLPPTPDEGVLTLLLLGSDEGPPRTSDSRRGRADGIQLLFVSGDRQHATFVSIPRDSWVSVPGRGNTRINACLANGPDRCVETVERLFNIDVDGYILTNMRAFAYAVREFGGLTVNVRHRVRDGGRPIEELGEQRLSGYQALAYARDRKNRPGGDFGRSEAQAELMAIAHREVVGGGTVKDVMDAVSILRRHSVTSLKPGQLVQLGFQAMHLPPKNVERHLASARIGRAGAASVVFLNDSAFRLVRNAADDARVEN